MVRRRCKLARTTSASTAGELGDLNSEETGSCRAGVDEDEPGWLLPLDVLFLSWIKEAEAGIQTKHGRHGGDDECCSSCVVHTGWDLPCEVTVDFEVLGEGAPVGEETTVNSACNAVPN
jgi:hypothetical protein